MKHYITLLYFTRPCLYKTWRYKTNAFLRNYNTIIDEASPYFTTLWQNLAVFITKLCLYDTEPGLTFTAQNKTPPLRYRTRLCIYQTSPLQQRTRLYLYIISILLRPYKLRKSKDRVATTAWKSIIVPFDSSTPNVQRHRGSIKPNTVDGFGTFVLC